MKYGNLELGQVEAIVNKLGGMRGVRNLLSRTRDYGSPIEEVLIEELERCSTKDELFCLGRVILKSYLNLSTARPINEPMFFAWDDAFHRVCGTYGQLHSSEERRFIDDVNLRICNYPKVPGGKAGFVDVIDNSARARESARRETVSE